jgi:hypothetical protein
MDALLTNRIHRCRAKIKKIRSESSYASNYEPFITWINQRFWAFDQILILFVYIEKIRLPRVDSSKQMGFRFKQFIEMNFQTTNEVGTLASRRETCRGKELLPVSLSILCCEQFK